MGNGQNQTENLQDWGTNASDTGAVRELLDLKDALDEFAVVMITDTNGVITYVNNRACELSGYSRDELTGTTPRILNSGYHPKSYFRTMWETIKAGRVWRGEICNQTKHGDHFWSRATIVPLRNEQGVIHKFLALRHDITDRVHAEAALQDALEKDFYQVVKNLQNGVFKLKKRDQADDIVFTLSEGQIAAGYQMTTKDIEGKRVKDVFPEPQAKKITHHVDRALQQGAERFELTLNDQVYLIYLTRFETAFAGVEVAGSIIDITDQKLKEQQIQTMAYYDSLTQLPNRRSFELALKDSLQMPLANGEKVAVFYINLDRFQSVNETLGHAVGDRLLKKVAIRLKTLFDQGAVLSRFSGVDFAVMVRLTCEDGDVIKHEAERIHAALREPVILDNMELYTSPAIGVSLAPDHGTDWKTIIQYADAAMNRTKQLPGQAFYVFDSELEASLLRRLAIEQELRIAIEEGTLDLYVQPKVKAKTYRLSGGEALLRWHHKELGTVSPEEFIPIAEEFGMIQDLGYWVIQEGARRLKSWHDLGLTYLSLSVNVSIRQFMQPTFASDMQGVLDETGVDPRKLELEITENVTANMEMTRKVMLALKEMGFIVSIDDFGTGYSSMQYLQELPFDRVKLDKTFVMDLSKANRSIMQATLKLASALSMSTVAEGVESFAHAAFLSEWGCEELQGFYFSHALSEADFHQYWIIPELERKRCQLDRG
ncbi:sensor domain-containing protein [Salisediminibacterium selenitireducens]|uniref:Diguanylate cyclase/phosphodiesterase with PAS/PAC sensor(S) n=1 Tax=Bacillus selenitireducens (strain ATCC 700615 / DSM 15326 / MLS10) TaxID=439292 RepID=D6Y0H6_BACIE|nr:GGDEF and EAL domain-containing protein [Salisediminibacterium selenitireducens]ADH98567.1 diguanylate cyclase/phosphodiesterase with PAS/PAC sensor(s) [[Bacillus] selenitireducens MLS10]